MRKTYIITRPPGVNACYINRKSGKGRGRIASPALRGWRRTAGMEILAQRVVKFETPVSMRLEVSEAGMDKRRRDVDGTIKATIDLLVETGVLVDDSRDYVRSVEATWTDGVPGTVAVVIMARDKAPNLTPSLGIPRDQIAIMKALRRRGIDVDPKRIHLQ